MADDFILETHGLTKEFAGFFAVRDVDLRVRRGSIHALIGPNGAGNHVFQSPDQVPEAFSWPNSV
jgi:ABC-type branched-subunit amino acid transport system ATPase component